MSCRNNSKLRTLYEPAERPKPQQMLQAMLALCAATAVCGDGVLDFAEACDDGNTAG